MKTTFKGTTLENCIGEACKLLNIDENELDYEIVKEKNGLFIKKVVIEVKTPELSDDESFSKGIDIDENYVESEKKEDDEVVQDEQNSAKSSKENGKVKIENENIIVTNNEEGGTPATIICGQDMKVFLDGNEVNGKVEVFEESKIEVIFEKIPATRHLDISFNDSKMEAYMTISYTPENIYVLKDRSEESNSIYLEKMLKAQKMPPKYTLEEVKQELSKMGIVYGIMEENITKFVEKDCMNVIIAKGDMPVDGKDEYIEYKFPIDNSIKKLVEDEKGKVDFKSIGSIESCKVGEIIAIKKEGSEGKDGKDITGKVIKHKPGKKIQLRAADGCTLRENTIVAIIEGKPCFKNNSFYVYKVHEVRSDVDLKTGNIKFVGDVIIYGSVKEGMEVASGNSIIIKKNVERASVQGKGDVTIDGNIIVSEILGGGEDVGKLNYIDNLTNLKESLQNLIKTTEEIKKYNLLGQEKKDGEIIKILIENKFKNLPKICLKIITGITINCDEDGEKNLIPIIKGKLIGLAPVNIRNYKELEHMVLLLDEKINILKGELSLPINVKINYCQDSKINSSGDIIVGGKGEYVSSLCANGGIYFTETRGMARGGELKAKNEIKCKVVGSVGGVATKLVVEENGHIWADIAYQNTIFVIGQKEFLLEIPSKDIHAYMDSKGELVVDRLML